MKSLSDIKNLLPSAAKTAMVEYFAEQLEQKGVDYTGIHQKYTRFDASEDISAAFGENRWFIDNYREAYEAAFKIFDQNHPFVPKPSGQGYVRAGYEEKT